MEIKFFKITEKKKIKCFQCILTVQENHIKSFCKMLIILKRKIVIYFC